MNLYLVKAIVGTTVKKMWIKCRTEVDAWERANAELYYGDRILEVKWIRRESY